MTLLQYPCRRGAARRAGHGLLLLGIVGGLLVLALAGGLGLYFALHLSEAPAQAATESEEDEDPPLPKPAPPPKDPRVTNAVALGVEYLKKCLLSKDRLAVADSRFGDQSQVGATALAGLALLEAGVSPRDKSVQQALQVVRAKGPQNTVVYSLGAILFFLNRMDEARALRVEDRQLLRTLALRLIGGQLADGRWTYHNPPLSPAAEKSLVQQLRAQTYKPTRAGAGSNSMTQFALLALWGARKHGVAVRQPLLFAAACFERTQKQDGTWDYALEPRLHDSNTCAGLLALAMDKILREDKEFRTRGRTDPPASAAAEKQKARALVHIAKAIGRKAQDPLSATNTPHHHYSGAYFRADAWGDFYFLWCLERVSVIYGLKRIGGKDWYKWGAEVLLKNQNKDGSWRDQHGAVPDTCFALLFLTQANLARDLTDKLRELMAQQPRAAAPEVPWRGRRT
jgi:hypothetical protein